MPKTKVVSVRLTIEELAKARDGLLEKNIDPMEINNLSQIVRLAFYYGLIYLCTDPKEEPTKESLHFINQKFNKTKATKNIHISNLMEKE